MLHVRFRLGGLSFPPLIYYKIFVHGAIVDINAFAPRDYQQIKKEKKTIHGYGASTKGNVLLQYFGIDNKYLDFIAERNPKKYGCYTPGTKIKIISEKKSRALKPDFYLVLSWHFKKEIIKRESSALKSGTKLIFPLPILKTISK